MIDIEIEDSDYIPRRLSDNRRCGIHSRAHHVLDIDLRIQTRHAFARRSVHNAVGVHRRTPNRYRSEPISLNCAVPSAGRRGVRTLAVRSTVRDAAYRVTKGSSPRRGRGVVRSETECL